MLGLTLEGGASRTVYSCGIMDALLEDKIIADYVIGVSQERLSAFLTAQGR